MVKETNDNRDRTGISPERLRRSRPPEDEEISHEPPSVSAGPIDKVIELAFNPSRDKIREVTIIDRVQGRLFPQMDMINYMRHYVLEIAHFRQDPDEYKREFGKTQPVPPEPLDEFMYRTAQWAKSVAGKNLEKATDIALAETEVKGGEGEEGIGSGADPWKD